MFRATLGIALAGMLLSSCALPTFGGDTITVTVRNDLNREVTLVITESQSLPARDRVPRTIAAPIVVPPGEHQVRLASPEPEWSVQLLGVEGFFDSTQLHEFQRQGSLVLTINEQGLVAETDGVP